MYLIRPSFEILTKIDRTEILKSIEKYGRTCYKSESKITDESASKFVKSIIERGHLSVIEHASVTVKIICDRGVSHELVRHRLASYSQESTRYVNYNNKGLTFIIPPLSIIEPGEYNSDCLGNDSLIDSYWYIAMSNTEIIYNKLIELGQKPEEARSVLPNSTKTEIIMTANLREWLHVFKMRCDTAAHPQMREIMIPLHDEFKKLLPEIFIN